MFHISWCLSLLHYTHLTCCPLRMELLQDWWQSPSRPLTANIFTTTGDFFLSSRPLTANIYTTTGEIFHSCFRPRRYCCCWCSGLAKGLVAPWIFKLGVWSILWFLCVVYIDQLLGAAHTKHCLKYAFFSFVGYFCMTVSW